MKRKLTAQDIQDIHDLHAVGISKKAIAREKGVCPKTIRYHLDKAVYPQV